jgi:hypothetical protein
MGRKASFLLLALGTDLAVSYGGTGQSTEANSLGEMTQVSEDITPDPINDFVPTNAAIHALEYAR